MKKIAPHKLKQMLDMFLVLPLIVIVTIIAIYFAFWRTDPLIRFSHMLWVLGFWMTGTLAMFAFILPMPKGIGVSIYSLLISAAAITLAVYFTPLSRFTNLFARQVNVTLPAAIGTLNLTTSWFLAFRFRNKIVQTQSH